MELNQFKIKKDVIEEVTFLQYCAVTHLFLTVTSLALAVRKKGQLLLHMFSLVTGSSLLF